MTVRTNPARAAIAEAIARVRRNGMALTTKNIRANVDTAGLTIGDATEALQRYINTQIPLMLKEQGHIITDAARSKDGRPRAGYYETGTAEHKEQLQIQAENGRYTQNRIAAETAVITFMEERTTDLGYEPPWLTIAEDVDRIYRMHGVAPPGVNGVIA